MLKQLTKPALGLALLLRCLPPVRHRPKSATHQ